MSERLTDAELAAMMPNHVDCDCQLCRLLAELREARAEVAATRELLNKCCDAPLKLSLVLQQLTAATKERNDYEVAAIVENAQLRAALAERKEQP